MLFFLVHELDSNLRAIADLRKLIQSERGAEDKSKQKEVAEAATEPNDAMKENYSEVMGRIFGCLSITVIYPTIAKFLDILLGPLQWKHVTALYTVIIASTVVTRRRPTESVIMIAALSIMPGFISGSLTSLLGVLFCLGTFCWRFLVYTWENISDWIEVRWVLISILLDLIYLGTATMMDQANEFGLKSIGLIVLVHLVENAMLYLGVIVTFSDGPWNGFFRKISPLSHFLRSFIWYIAQLSLFLLNRLARHIFAATFKPKSPHDNSA